MKKAVMYGAGNIGRGFIGKVFSESGYEVCFIDVMEEVVNKLNADGCYPVKIVMNDQKNEVMVPHVRAVNGLDIEKVATEILAAEIMATAVGVNILPRIVKAISLGLKKRYAEGKPPLNIIICENMIDADKYLRKMIEMEMGEEYKAFLDNNLGLVEASIGRMVPVMTDDMREGNLLKVWVEPYHELPVDKDAFIGEIPDLEGIIPFSPFGYYLKRKLFIHNLGHSICAFMGWLRGYHTIYECVKDIEIRKWVVSAMLETAEALQIEYQIPMVELKQHIDDLVNRFSNRALGDTIVRVARDPIRKLGANDRLIGAANYCISLGIHPSAIIKGISYGLQYNEPTDESAQKMQSTIANMGVENFVEEYCGVQKETKLFQDIIMQYHNTTDKTQ